MARQGKFSFQMALLGKFYTFLDLKYNSTLLEFLDLIYDWRTKYQQVSNLLHFCYILSLFW